MIFRPFGSRPHQEFRAQAKVLESLFVQKRFKCVVVTFAVAAEHEVAALEQRAGILETDGFDEGPQISHRHLLVAANVDAAQEGDVRLHGNVSSANRGVMSI